MESGLPRSASRWIAPALMLLINSVAEAGDYVYFESFVPRPDTSRDTDDHGAGIQAGYGRPWRNRAYFEVHGHSAVLETGIDGISDFYQYGIGLDLRYEFDGKRLQPFVLAGAGVVRNDVVPNSADSIDVFANVGAGFHSAPVYKNLRIRAEARVVYDTFERGMLDLRLALGVVIPLGDTRVVQAPKIIEVPVEKIVYRDAAPLPDTDGDGVPDPHDGCPASLPDSKVDMSGCATTGQVTTLTGVTFEFDRTRLTAEAKVILDGVVETLRGQPDMRAEIAGHTDALGSDKYNQVLSEGRAASVREYLISRGIAADRVTSRGYGEREPTATNDTEEGRQLNRRVEFRVK